MAGDFVLARKSAKGKVSRVDCLASKYTYQAAPGHRQVDFTPVDGSSRKAGPAAPRRSGKFENIERPGTDDGEPPFVLEALFPNHVMPVSGRCL